MKARIKEAVTVKQSEGNEVPVEIMAQAICDISQAMKRLSSSRLKREAIVALIKDKSGLTKKVIEIVLSNLESLETTWLKK